MRCCNKIFLLGILKNLLLILSGCDITNGFGSIGSNKVFGEYILESVEKEGVKYSGVNGLNERSSIITLL